MTASETSASLDGVQELIHGFVESQDELSSFYEGMLASLDGAARALEHDVAAWAEQQRHLSEERTRSEEELTRRLSEIERREADSHHRESELEVRMHQFVAEREQWEAHVAATREEHAETLKALEERISQLAEHREAVERQNADWAEIRNQLAGSQQAFAEQADQRFADFESLLNRLGELKDAIQDEVGNFTMLAEQDMERQEQDLGALNESMDALRGGTALLQEQLSILESVAPGIQEQHQAIAALIGSAEGQDNDIREMLEQFGASADEILHRMDLAAEGEGGEGSPVASGIASLNEAVSTLQEKLSTVETALPGIQEQQQAIAGMLGSGEGEGEDIKELLEQFSASSDEMLHRVEEHLRSSAEAGGEGGADFGRALERLEQELDESRRQLHEAEASRHAAEERNASLQAELESAHAKIDGLNKTLTDHEVRADQEKQEILDELHRLSDAMGELMRRDESGTQAGAEKKRTRKKATRKKTRSAEGLVIPDEMGEEGLEKVGAEAEGDALLSSVMAQFESLKDDLAKRR